MRASRIWTAAFVLGAVGVVSLCIGMGNGYRSAGQENAEARQTEQEYTLSEEESFRHDEEGAAPERGEEATLPEGGFGMFSWEETVLSEDESDRMADCIRRTSVTEVYQEFTEESLQDGRAAAFADRLCGQAVSVYALMGDAEWAYEEDAATLTERIREIASFNEKQPEGAEICGVMVDVEPYVLDEWGEGAETRRILMESYLSCMSEAYACAQEKGLEFLVCIPESYDASYPEVLEKLIADACDGVAVMNYDRTDEYMQMAKETGYAREYRKRIICIYELQRVGAHDLTEINTYHDVGLEALWASARRLRLQFGYDRLSFAYHYYLPMLELLSTDD